MRWRWRGRGSAAADGGGSSIPTLIDYQNGSYVEGGQKILLFLRHESDFYLTSRRVLSESEKDEKVSIEAQLVVFDNEI